MLRGDWSIGDVLGRYFHNATCGDQYVGRVVAGLDVHGGAAFKRLPPHFMRSANAVLLDEGIESVFGNTADSILRRIVNDDGRCTWRPVLVRLLASLVWHEAWLRANLPADHRIFTAVSL